MLDPNAVRLNKEAGELSKKGRFAEAEAAYRAAAAVETQWSVPWYNLGLMQKYRQSWAESLACNLRATELDGSDVAGWWNLGIAATALGNWDLARKAWRKCEIAIPAGEGPIEMDLGHVPIRLADGGEPEVVWARRIDPARAVLVSVPLPDSGHTWGDLVLHDGAANGHRILHDRQVPVFDELARLRRSGFGTFVVELEADAAALDALSDLAEALGGAAEDWSTNTRILCKACSEGTPNHTHDATETEPAHPHCGIAARDDVHLQEIVATWIARLPHARVLSWRAAGAAERGTAPDEARRGQLDT